MTAAACERWAVLSDRRACGEPLSPRELDFFEVHVERCERCAAEARLWAALGESLEHPAHLMAPLDRDGALAMQGAGVATKRSSWRAMLRLGAPAAAAAALVLAVGAMVREDADGRERSGTERPADPPQTTATVAGGSATLVLASGEVAVRGTRARGVGSTPELGDALSLGDTLHVGRGRACLRWGASVLCAGEGSDVTLESSSDQKRVLELRSGLLVAQVEKQDERRRFIVRTPRGSVTVKGTIFATAVEEDGGVEVRVERGAVLVRDAAGAEQLVRASREVRLSGGIEERVADPGRLRSDAAWMEAASTLGQDGFCELEVRSEPLGAEVRLDGAVFGPSPAAAQLPCGVHELSLSRDGFVEERRRVNLVRGGSSELVALAPRDGFTGEAKPAHRPPRASSDERSPQRAPEALLAEARRHRSRGRYAAAAAVYRRVVAEHGSSAEAGTALLALGELELSQLGNPRAALGAFDRYLSRGGSLSQEARYGRIRALQNLGRHREAEAAAAQFIRDYPASAQAAQLRGKTSRAPRDGR